MKLSLTNERINAQGGLNLTGSILSYHTPLAKLFAKRLPARSDKISDVDILTTQIGLLCQGRTHYEDVELYRQDEAEGFSLSMGIGKIRLFTRYAWCLEVTNPTKEGFEGVWKP